MKCDSDKFQNYSQEEEENIKKKEFIENPLKQIRQHCEEIKEIKVKNVIIQIILIILFINLLIFLLSIFKLSFNTLSLTKKIKNFHNIQPIETKRKIITIGFYDVMHCDRRWRRVKKGYFYELPKYTNKFRWVFLAKNGVD